MSDKIINARLKVRSQQQCFFHFVSNLLQFITTKLRLLVMKYKTMWNFCRQTLYNPKRTDVKQIVENCKQKNRRRIALQTWHMTPRSQFHFHCRSRRADRLRFDSAQKIKGNLRRSSFMNDNWLNFQSKASRRKANARMFNFFLQVKVKRAEKCDFLRGAMRAPTLNSVSRIGLE